VGPLLVTGLSTFGAAVALGLIASGTWPSDGTPTTRQVPTGRSLAIVLMAFCVGVACLGTVVGLLDIFIAGDVADPADGLLAAGPSVVGGLIGLILVGRHARAGDPTVTTLAALYVVTTASLGIVVALLALFVVEEPTKSLPDWPFVIVGLINAACALAIGATGATAVAGMLGVDEPTSSAIARAQIMRCALLQIPFVAASAVAIVLIVS
jgi:hypothetical protein